MRIVLLHAGGIGDLVLLEALLSALRDQHPRARLELLCRGDVAPVASLYACPPDAVHAFAFNPYTWAMPSEAIEPCRAYLAALPPGPVDLFVSAELHATWLSEVLAAALDPIEALFGDPSTFQRSTARIVVRGLGYRLRPQIRRLGRIPEEHELDRYARLHGGERRLPSLRPLRPQREDPDAPLVMFPVGIPALKCWPFERFAAAAAAVRAGTSRPLVLIGSDSERARLDELAASLPAGTCAIRTGLTADLAALAETIAGAWGYLGADTGLAHLAAAYEVPGVTVYGGGTWPAYAPWGRRAAGVVAPIPCFGCLWDCAFGRAYCVEAVGVDDVVRAFSAALSDDAGEPFTIANEAYDTRARTVFAEASRSYRAAQIDRAARLRAIIRLRDILERYALRSRTRQSGTITPPDHLTHRLMSVARRLTQGPPTGT